VFSPTLIKGPWEVNAELVSWARGRLKEDKERNFKGKSMSKGSFEGAWQVQKFFVNVSRLFCCNQRADAEEQQ